MNESLFMQKAPKASFSYESHDWHLVYSDRSLFSLLLDSLHKEFGPAEFLALSGFYIQKEK